MKLRCLWNEKLKFTAEADHHQVEMDTKRPLGNDAAMTPKQLVLAGLCGCTGMDVISLMKKHKQPVEKFEIEADAVMTEGAHPITFKEFHLVFRLTGRIDRARVIEAVTLSQTKYCGVSAALVKAAPIFYSIEINGEEVGSGQAQF
jgi:putative redox protein